MAKYKAVHASYGYQGRYWNAGEIVEIGTGVDAPPKEHFVAVGKEAAQADLGEGSDLPVADPNALQLPEEGDDTKPRSSRSKR